MRRRLTNPEDAAGDDPLTVRTLAILDARLDRASAAPIALALSGGGDSLALLRLACVWRRRRGRPLLALTVDHGLDPRSADWTAAAAAMAASVGAAWRALAWAGPKPSTGVPSAARAARHALIADAARAAGARVVLMAHTADDVAEGERMRAADAPGLGRLQAWGPSPAWPQGRSLALFRPLLGERRAALRTWLTARGLSWIEDPANADASHPRVRARRALAGAPDRPEAADEPLPHGPAFEADAFGVIHLGLDELLSLDPRRRRGALSRVIACAAGVREPPAGSALDRLVERLCAGGEHATLGGARVVRQGCELFVGRELGRRPPDAMDLTPGAGTVFDGRVEVVAPGEGWRMATLGGRTGRLSDVERRRLGPLPRALRPGVPVGVDSEGCAFLWPPGGARRSLVGARLAMATGQVRTEAELEASVQAAPD